VNSQGFRISCWVAILASFVRIASPEEPASYKLPDHLLPADLEILGKEYVATVERKLCVTPSDYGRVLILPAFTGEEALSVYSLRSSGGQESHYVTWTVASENLNDRTRSGHDPDESKHVGIRRLDAEIPERTARLVRQVWAAALKQVRPLSKDERALELSFTDAAVAEFSLAKPDKHTATGRTVMAPGRLENKMNELVTIASLLRDYCQSESADRPSIASKIDREATALLAQLK
jgi:hypothetical protein